MLSRYAVPVLCAAALVFACAPRPHAAESSTVDAAKTATAATPVKKQKPDTLHPVAAALAVRAQDGVRFALTVTTRGAKNVELMFPSGQTHDFVVLDAAGKEAWRWSESRMFTQAMQSRMLAVGESTTYEESWTPPTGATGRYTVVATLRSTNHVVEERAAFVVP